MSQHLALTPQLQQSIRLLQLSTLELSQEVEQMLDENPFLERSTDEAPQEDFGLPEADARVSLGDRVSEAASDAGSDSRDAASESTASVSNDEAVTDVADSWDGDGSVEIAPDDSEWGTDGRARNNNTKHKSERSKDIQRGTGRGGGNGPRAPGFRQGCGRRGGAPGFRGVPGPERPVPKAPRLRPRPPDRKSMTSQNPQFSPPRAPVFSRASQPQGQLREGLTACVRIVA